MDVKLTKEQINLLMRALDASIYNAVDCSKDSRNSEEDVESYQALAENMTLLNNYLYGFHRYGS